MVQTQTDFTALFTRFGARIGRRFGPLLGDDDVTFAWEETASNKPTSRCARDDDPHLGTCGQVRLEHVDPEDGMGRNWSDLDLEWYWEDRFWEDLNSTQLNQSDIKLKRAKMLLFLPQIAVWCALVGQNLFFKPHKTGFWSTLTILPAAAGGKPPATATGRSGEGAIATVF